MLFVKDDPIQRQEAASAVVEEVIMSKRSDGESQTFYSGQYRRFSSPLAADIRRMVYGEDLGQQGWRSLEEQEAIVELIVQFSPCRVLDVACGSGGPSLALVRRTGCWLTGIDSEPSAIAWARKRTQELGLAARAQFEVVDCNRALPFDDRAFDIVVCIDAILHLADRTVAVGDWARCLRLGGRILFTDAAVLTGPMSKDDIDIRASQGSFTVAPPGANESAIAAAGLSLLGSEDTTEAAAVLAARWLEVRERFSAPLVEQEGEEFFANRQRFLKTTAELAASKRLSRFLYLAEKHARA
jgi:SAM-dependent methyltransferase